METGNPETITGESESLTKIVATQEARKKYKSLREKSDEEVEEIIRGADLLALFLYEYCKSSSDFSCNRTH
jgi:hypothetical protein